MQANQPTLGGEGVLLLYLRREPPGVFQAVVGLNHLDGKGEIQHKGTEKSCAGSGFYGFEELFEDDARGEIYGSVLVVCGAICGFDVLRIYLDFFSWQIASADEGALFLAVVCTFLHKARPPECTMNTGNGDGDSMALDEEKPDIFRPLVCLLTELDDACDKFWREAAWRSMWFSREFQKHLWP